MSITLYEHNRVAYQSVVAMLAESGKAAVIHPTGTGKSFIAFKLCEEHSDKAVLWLSPSEYIFKTQLENFKAAGGKAPKNITFATYSKFSLYTDEEIKNIRTDYLILDEFHRCGAEVWQKNIGKFLRLFPDVPVLGLSATAIRYLDGQRDMSEELFDGNVASEMTLGEAVAQGILNPPTYIISMYGYEKELKKYERKLKKQKYRSKRAKAQDYLEKLRRALEMADGLDVMFDKHMKDRTGKYLVFCENYEHMQEMLELTPKWFCKVDQTPHIYSVYSDDPETSAAFAAFKADNDPEHLKLLYCIDMLNEGIHVENVSGVILLRPTVSPIIYKQQIGRALSASKEKEPIIFDVVNNFENLYSISALQEEIRAAITYYRYLGEDSKIVNERFTIVDELRDCRELFDALEDSLTFSWDEMYAKAKAYYTEHGNLEVPSKYKTADGYSLGHWLSTQRMVRAGKQYGRLNEAQIRKLDEIGMRWESVKDVSWKRYYSAAKRYYEQYGDLKVPAQYVTPEGILLGNWINNIRTYKRNSIHSNFLTPERVTALEEIGMVWDVMDYLWERNYLAAMEFYRENGHLDVPSKYISKDGLKIGYWIRNLRNTLKGCYPGRTLTEEQICRLNEIGMQWEDKYTRQWKKGYSEAKIYYEAHGNLNVPNSYTAPSGYKLGEWISNQREKQHRMKAERKERLDQIGMIWKKPDSWEVRYALAKAYYDKHGDLKVPGPYVVNGIWLGKWLNEQKQIYRGNRKGKSLTKEQIERLNVLNIDWGEETRDDQGLRYAQAYYAKHGNLEVPQKYMTEDGFALGVWLRVLRTRYSEEREQIPSDLVAKLNTVGMRWGTLKDARWEQGYAEAKAYYNKHENLEIAHNYVTESGYKLGIWMNNQRANREKLDVNRKKRLDALGMRWQPVDTWSKNYALAKEYYDQHGNLDIPIGFRKNRLDLKQWLLDQRRIYRGKRKGQDLTKEQIEKLNAIGMEWRTPSEVAWENGYRFARNHYETYGDLNLAVTYRTEEGFGLGAWVQNQRKSYKDGKLTKNQITLLNQCGMVWDIKVKRADRTHYSTAVEIQQISEVG